MSKQNTNCGWIWKFVYNMQPYKYPAIGISGESQEVSDE